FNLNLVRIDDIIECMPARLQRSGRLHSSIASILKARFDAAEPVQCTLGNGQRGRLYPIGSKALLLSTQNSRTLSKLYEKSKADAKKGVLIPDEGLDAEEEFGDT